MASNPKGQPCPICKIGFFRSHRELSAHQTICPGPTNYDNTDHGIETRKRNFQQLHEPETLLQQQYRLDDESDDRGFDLVRQPLYFPPTLEHLASTQTSAEATNVETFELIEVTTDSNGATIEKSPILTNIPIPKEFEYQVEFQNILHSHRRVDLNLGDELNQCTERYAMHYGCDFRTHKMLTQDSLIKELATAYKLYGLKPKLEKVELHDGTFATVPIFNAKAMLLKVLNDKTKMQEKNFAPNYDI